MGLVARPWFLMEICSKQDIINIVTDASAETTKIGLSPKPGILIIQKKAAAQFSPSQVGTTAPHPLLKFFFLSFHKILQAWRVDIIVVGQSRRLFCHRVK